MGSQDGFPTKRQEFKVERSAVDTEPDGMHYSSICAGDPANGHSPACVPAIRADEDHFKYSLCFHLVTVIRREGVGSRRIKLYPSLLVRVPTLSPHAAS